jgi:hypothetical protein
MQAKFQESLAAAIAANPTTLNGLRANGGKLGMSNKCADVWVIAELPNSGTPTRTALKYNAIPSTLWKTHASKRTSLALANLKQPHPMQEPMLNELRYLEDTPAAEQVLQGGYEPPEGTDKYMQDILLELHMPQVTRDGIKEHGFISTEISLLENRQRWQKCRLASAEPSGLTMDHYAVGGVDESLNEIDSLLRQLPYRIGFSPEAWQTITDVEILKKVGIFDVELMRTIQLMHAEFNMNIKKLGGDMMSFAESGRALTAEQFGRRKNHHAILAALNKRLTNGIWQGLYV